MERNLFTKIYTSEDTHHSSHVASALLDHLIEGTALQVRQKQIEGKQVEFLARQIMKTEVHTLGQAVTRDPFAAPLPQDPSAVNHAYEPKRPMSAKINHATKMLLPQQLLHCKKTRRANNQQTRSSAKSTQNIAVRQSSKRYGFQKENTDKYFPLTCKAEGEDSLGEDQQLIAEMRLKKTRENQLEKTKTQFFQTIANEEERSSKLNKRFVQLMGSKTYYYNSRGEALEVQQPSRGLKKSGTSKMGSQVGTSQAVTQQSSKRFLTNHQKKEESIYVEFKPKHSNFRSSLQADVLDDRGQTLFFKSDQCQYRVIS